MLDASILAALSPRSRWIIAHLDSMPADQRSEAFRKWCQGQPDGEAIKKQVENTNASSPPPGGFPIKNNGAN